MSDTTNTTANNTTNNTLELESELMDQLSKMDLVRGESPDNIEKRCLKLCQEFIGGTWSLATVNDVEVKRISGGMTNQLWHAKLNDAFPRIPNGIYPDEPSEVAIKLFQTKHMKNYHDDDHERLNDIVILTVMAEAGIGPKIYGVFHDGFIQGFHKHEHFRAKHQNDPKHLEECIALLAKIHHMKVPIRKTKDLVLDFSQKNLLKASENPVVEQFCKEENFKNLLEHDLRTEWKLIRKMIQKLNPPSVFCHCDFRGGNILMTDQGIVCIDMEYSNYGSRPFDIATILTEWGKVEIFEKTMKVPTDEVIRNFISLYIKHCDLLQPGYRSAPENQPEVLFKEVKIFLAIIFFTIVSFLYSCEESLIAGVPFDRKEFLKHAEITYGFYRNLKEELYEHHFIEEEDF